MKILKNIILVGGGFSLGVIATGVATVGLVISNKTLSSAVTTLLANKIYKTLMGNPWKSPEYQKHSEYDSEDFYEEPKESPVVPIIDHVYSTNGLYSFSYPCFNSRERAEKVLYSLQNQISKLGFVRVSYFLSFFGSGHTEEEVEYGWTDLKDAPVVCISENYWKIKFPDVVYIDSIS